MSLQTISDIMDSYKKIKLVELKHPEKGGSFQRAGKKEGVWGRNFCLPFLSSSKFSTRLHPRRPKGGGRRGLKLPGKLGLSFSAVFFKISPNLPVKAAPYRICQFFRAKIPRNLQLASHFLPRDPEVRLRGAQSSAIEINKYLGNKNTQAEQPIFCLSPKVKVPNFHSAGGGTKKATIFPLICPC